MRSLCSYVGGNGVRFGWADVRRSGSGFVLEIWLATTTERCEVVAWFTSLGSSDEKGRFKMGRFRPYIG